jgi:hypothetical protein
MVVQLRELTCSLPGFPVYVLDPSKRMDDRMLITLSESTCCLGAVGSGHPELLLAFAPLILDLRSLRDPDVGMPRERRLEYITVLFCFMLLTLLLKRDPRLVGAC